MLAVHEYVRLVPGRNAVAAVRAPSQPRRRRPPRYGALALLRHGLSGRQWPRAWPDQPLRNRYDVVIIGGGVHGLAAAYLALGEPDRALKALSAAVMLYPDLPWPHEPSLAMFASRARVTNRQGDLARARGCQPAA